MALTPANAQMGPAFHGVFGCHGVLPAQSGAAAGDKRRVPAISPLLAHIRPAIDYKIRRRSAILALTPACRIRSSTGPPTSARSGRPGLASTRSTMAPVPTMPRARAITSCKSPPMAMSPLHRAASIRAPAGPSASQNRRRTLYPTHQPVPSSFSRPSTGRSPKTSAPAAPISIALTRTRLPSLASVATACRHSSTPMTRASARS